jgi:hypothetical protein
MYLLNTLLAVVLGAAALVAVVIRAFAPIIIIPDLDIPAMVLVSLVALLLDHYLAPGAKRCWICIPVLSAVTFGLLSWAACFAGAAEAVKIGLFGGVVFTVIAWLFTSIQDRLSSGPACKAAPVLSALGLYLAFQSFMGMFL